MARGGYRPGAGRKPNPDKAKKPAAPVEVAKVPAEPRRDFDMQALAAMLPDIQAISEKYSRKRPRERSASPFRPAQHPKSVMPPQDRQMAMDSALTGPGGGIDFANAAWADGGVAGFAEEGLVFLGYPYLSELAQRPEYRVISETIADDATRKWIDFDVAGDEEEKRRRREADPVGEAERERDPDERRKRIEAAGKTDKIKALKDDQERLEVRSKFYDIARLDGFFGRSHLFLDFGVDAADRDELMAPIGNGRDAMSRGKIAKNSLKQLKVIEPVWTYPLGYNAENPIKPFWYDPQTWFVMGTEIHASRLLTFIGHPVPDLLKPAYSFGGISLTQMAKPYVDIWLTTRQSVADIIHSFSVMVLMTDLQTILQPGNAGALLARVAMFNMLRDNQGVFAINKNTEDFKNVSASLSGLHELQAQAQEHMASVSRIPLVKLTGIQPAGLNASSEGEIKVYDDTISAYQNRFFRPGLTRVINFQQLSMFGKVDPEISFHFEPLREMTQAEKGQKEKDDADRDQKYVDMGAIAPGEVRKRILDDTELPYAGLGLDPDDVPDLAAEEAGGLEPEGGRPQSGAEGEGDEDDRESAGGLSGKDADPFGATDAEWREDDHPRAPDGKFGKGSGGGKSSAPKQSLKMPQFGLTPTPATPHQAGGFKLPTRAPMPKSSGKPKDASSLVAFEPGGKSPVKALNGVPFKSWGGADDWSKVEGQAEIAEPPVPDLSEGMRLASGVIITEPDGRVWVMRPKGGFGGYHQTFPKGGVEDGLSPQANAIKEAWEETGLKVKITGFVGDYEGDTSVSRFYRAERVGGDPADAGPESEGVILAPPDKLDGLLNRSRDKKIAGALATTEAKPALNPKDLTKIGGQKGSNEGGVFEDKSGARYYIKRPATKAHVANELAAARLYQLAGVNTLDYRPVEGGNHVATSWQKLDKGNIKDFTPEEKKEAARDFAIHAWLGNWDAAGTGGDNQGIVNGKPTTLDVGGSLRYRAQGGPKGSAWGDKVAEIDTMRDPKMSPDAARLFGKMSDADLRASVERVTSIPDAAIKAAVGDDADLAKTLIARKRNLASRFDVQAADEAPFEENKHPRAPDGKFTSGGGGGGSSAASKSKQVASITPEDNAKNYGGLYVMKHESPSENHAATVKSVLSGPAKAGHRYRKLVTLLMSEASTFGTGDQKAALKQKLAEGWAASAAYFQKKGQTDKAEAAAKKAVQLGYKPPAAPGSPIPTKVESPPSEAKKLPPPTEAELNSAKKNVALQMQFVKGEKPTTGKYLEGAELIIKAFNDKYAGKTLTDPTALAQKVADYKGSVAAIGQLAKIEQANKAADFAAAQEAAKKVAAEKAAAAKKEAEESAKKNAKVMEELGISSSQAEGFAALTKMLGGTQEAAIEKFKGFAKEAEKYGYPLTGFEAALVKSYSDGSYGSVNAALRSEKWTTAQHLYVSMVNRAVAKMPKYTGEVIRNTNLTADQIAYYSEGHVVQEKALMSTSTKKPNGIFSGNVRFVVTAKGRRASSIQKLSHYGSEDEVLFSAKTYFKVNKVEKLDKPLKTGATTVIHLEEWDDL